MESKYGLSRKATFCRGKNSSLVLAIAGQVHNSYNAVMKQVGSESLGGWQEQLLVESQTRRRGYHALSPEESEWGIRLRVRVVWVGCVILLAAVLARVVYLQVFESGQKLLLAETNHVEQVRIPAVRGKLLDKDGKVLAESIFDVSKNGLIRQYPLGKATASIVGYLSETTNEELGCREGVCYESGAMIGRAGLEKAFESLLKGRDGGVIQEIDVEGRVVRERGNNESEAGEDVVLSLDSRLQELMYTTMEGKRGAAVALDMQGKVLGLVTTPTYDPVEISKYLADKSESYFLNRATGGVYPPGSVFKLVTAYTGLARGVITKDTLIEDTGEIKIGDYRYGTWYFDQYGQREGNIALVKALSRSNDVFFYKVGEGIGVNELVKSARNFGLGQPTGIEIPGEAAGLVPDPLWKERRTGEQWFLGNTYHLAIGQGDLLVTPLQVARMTLGAVSGRTCNVSILKNKHPECRELGLSSLDMEIVKEGMKGACATGGTAFPLFNFSPYVICKTGTAQHGGQKTKEDLPHAWITVAYPGENPEMILTVFVEAGGEGSAVAGALAKTILEGYRGY